MLPRGAFLEAHVSILLEADFMCRGLKCVHFPVRCHINNTVRRFFCGDFIGNWFILSLYSWETSVLWSEPRSILPGLLECISCS